ncbi:unnamed protein product [Paramecium sonneborni]|uniref:Transmembrane protein n=1 Tax=Paramecium sonneborni TaxID=65129 RepID=A0A8S1PMK1_9CILI|nr:unnamed protein product [Paramecium sonneborni]
MLKMFTCDKISQMIPILVIVLRFVHSQSCPYNEYEQALIPFESQYESNQFDSLVTLDVGDSFGFGFWSLCIPQLSLKNIPEVEQDFISTDAELGQLLFLVKGSTSNSLLGFVQIDLETLLIKHKIIILGSNQISLEFSFQPINYQAKWILSFITFNFLDGNIEVDMTDQIRQSGTMNIGQDYVQIIQGGRGYIENLNLNVFKGRLSKIFINKIDQLGQDLFEYMTINCQIPSIIQGEQTTYFVKGLQIFEGDTSLQYTINQFGSKFCLSGWVKYDISRVIQYSIYPLIRVSLFKNYFHKSNFGDEIFLMQVWFSKSEPIFTKIVILLDYHKIPIMGSIGQEDNDLIKVIQEIIPEYNSQYFIQELQQWHFVKYEYGSSIPGKKSCINIKFFNELNLLEFCRDIIQPTNSPFYVNLGSDEYMKELLQASLFDFKFEYNYVEEKVLLKNACHYTCLTCDGPLQNNCISCEQNTNRYHLDEQKKCQCLYGYVEVQDEKVCQQFEYHFSSVEQQEQYPLGDSLCEFGYFIFQNEYDQNVCIKCPQSNFLDILCVDCVYYPLTWYLKPICKFDLVSKKLTQTDAYKYEKRDIYDYDFYLIDQNGQLFLHSGYLDYCEPEQDSINCFPAKYQHIGQTIYVKCKPNYYQLNGDCIFTNINCLLASSDGNCQKVRDGVYLHNGQYYQCPLTCFSCIFDNNTNTPQCLSCINHYALDNGSCVPCGNFCSFCQKFNDQTINKSYLKCFKCLDDSKYFLSFDGINCFENTINHCEYAFQAVYYDYQINTLDLYFTPRDDWENIDTTCGRCQYGYGVILNSYICLEMRDANCYFSYVDYICDTIFDETMLNILDEMNYYITPSGEFITTGFDDDGSIVCTSLQYCLISQDYILSGMSKINQFMSQCPGFIENCATCLIEKVNWIASVIICLECKSGYYADRISGKCYVCPSELNCYNCAQQLKITQDYWKINIRALYQVLINFDNNHPFKLYAQSENKDDYEVICTMCIKEYELVEQKCIKECPESCLECQFINGENQCIRCELEQQGRQLSLSENQCITCPQNCALCRIRSDDEISSINPLFNNHQYMTSTYQCLQSFDDQDYYYDQELGTFIPCSNTISCEQSLIIPINLYCSKLEFTLALNSFQSTYEQNQFKLKNILLEDLTSGNSFKEFETNHFYLSANSKLIKTIIINILSVKPQTCKIFGNATIQQIFSENIFSTINVELNIQLNQHTIIEFERTITFQNFNKITIQGAQINPLSNNKLKQILFISKLPQIIILKSILYQQLNQENDQSKMIFYDVKKLDLMDFKIIDLIQNTINTFIFIADTTYNKQITLSSFQILNSKLQNQVTLFFNLNQNDIISIIDVVIQAQFSNSTLIDTKMTKQFGSLEMSNVDFQIDVLNCLHFLNLFLFKQVTISGIYFHNSQIQSSTFVILNNNNQIQDFIIKDCKFRERSYGIVNSDLLQLEQLQIELLNLIIQENEYHQTTKLLQFHKYNNVNSKIMIKNILISNNYVSSISEDFKLNTQSSCIIYISIDYILIQALNIIRGIGLIDFSIVEAKQLKITSSKITQGDEYKFLGLHQYLDCQLQQVKGEYYLQSLFMTSVLNLEIVDMQITNTQSYNSPILYYKSFDKGKQQQLETILINNISVKSNLLLLSNSQYQTAIIFIDSVQQTNIDLQNITFSENILHEYVQNNLQISSLLLNLNCIQGVITIKNSNFLKNTVYNSTDNLIYIKSQKLILQNCTFYQNSYFNYQLIQPYLLWGFFESEKVSFEQMKQLFKVKSTSGVAQLLIQNLEIQYCNFEQSVGSSGGALQIKAQKNSLITIYQTQFKNISTTFSQELAFGGAIHLDSTSAQSLEVIFQQIFIENITAKEQGGFIYILSNSASVNITFLNFKIRNVYSKLGSIVYFTFSSASSNQQYVNLNQFIIENTNDGFTNYLNKYTQLSKTEEIAITNNRALFYIDSAINIIIVNIEIDNLILESVLSINNAQMVSIQNFKISNSLISHVIFRLRPNQYLTNNIQISGLTISNITVALQLKIYNCLQENDKDYTVYFKCIQNAKNTQAPLNLFSQYVNQQDNYGECLLSQIKQQNGKVSNLMIQKTEQGLIQFLDLTESSQIKLNNLLLTQITCDFCQNGLLFYSFLKMENLLMKQYISKLKITNSSCGVYGCFYIKKENSNTNRRALSNQDKQLQSLNLEVFIDNYVCQYNQAQNGTCLFAENVKILIENSIFQFNNASGTGGAMIIKLKQDVLITNSLIQHNSAQTGGGISLFDQQDMDYFKLGTIIDNNKAEFFGNDKASLPQKLTITLKDEDYYFQTITIQETEELVVQQVMVSSSELNKQQYILLPSGQKISLYEQFDKINKTYYPFNQKFRVIALSKDNSVMKNLQNTYCEIDSRIFNTTNLNDDNIFSNNLTNIKNISFNIQTQDYNLDDLIVNFDNALPIEIVLQLQFRCNSIFIPIFNQQYPYNLISSHSNYKLRVNIKTLGCQYGEIKNNTDYSCIPCNSDQGLFSLNLNSEKCELKDDVSTINVQPALLNLKFGYWRPYFQSSKVSYCLNLPENCLGGWEEGDNSCFLGHIGALCEQCDLYNIRGDGYYSVSSTYSCGSCLEKEKNALIITFVSIWTLISILVSVQSTLKAIEEFVRIINIMMLGLAVTQNSNQSAILIKMLTNYLQIISSISTFQLKLPTGLQSTINAVGSPIQTMTYSLDCFLSQIFQFQIQYSRMIWQVIMPFLYITFFLICYLLAVKFKNVTFNRSVITTTLIYMYIYLQPSLIGGFVQLVSYREISGYKWIQSNVSYRFDTAYHEKWMLELCLPMLLLLAIIIPLYFFYGLYSNSHQLDDKKVRLQWGYLYNEYTKTAYFWEVIKILQKELMIIFLTYYDDKVIIKATIISLIIGMYLELSLKYKPYNLNNLNKLDYYSTNVCLASIALAIGIYISEQSNSQEIQIPYVFIISILNLNMLYTLISKILIEYLKEKSSDFDEKFDKLRNSIRTSFPSLIQIPFMKRILTNRHEQRERVAKLYHKLKQFLIPQAKEIIAFKNYQWQIAMERQMEQNIDQIPLSLRSPDQAKERQQFIRKSIRESSLNYSRNTITAFVLEKMKQKRVDEMAEIFEVKKQQSSRVTPIAYSEKFIKEIQEE